MDAVEPPRIQLEGAGPCLSAGRLEALLRSGMGAARAPGGGWVVAMHVEKTTAKTLRAEGDITDGSGTPVARRVISGSTADCDALARAVGVWASLVLDAELSRPATANDATPKDPANGGPLPRSAEASSAAAPAPQTLLPETPDAPLPPRIQGETTPPAARAEPHALEVGLGTFLMVGPRARAFAGATPYAVVETGHGFFLRPSVAFGEGFPPPSPNEQIIWTAARLDACLRVPGLYPPGHGLKLDICGGADGGFSYQSGDGGTVNSGSASIAPFVSVGPSLEMNGDLPGALSLVLRGVAGVNIVPDGWTGRIEVALSWRLR